MKKLSQQAALITGGSRGIGAAIAKRLAREGADVALTYQHAEEKAEAVVRQIRNEGVKALAIRADSADPEAVMKAVDRTQAELGRLNILVNNAGIGMYKPIAEFTVGDFDRIMSVNVRAVFAASHAALKYLGKGGRIIHIGSCQAERMPGPGGSLYAMSKSALVGLTKGMARDLGPRGITVNIIHPGPVDTDMNPADGPSAGYQRSLMAIPEYGSGEDIAAMAAYLAGPESGYITGAGFTVDGGTNA
ncbi:3-oxoacyl-ACP reductase family protein [Compostibacter hankyongensis]|uniref:3-oxoacyl-ACP reductase FabG n=1 Tax=Compostibacter hankyongensis TaxID=1007089 RepID=A0ABP8G0P1_9BACT